MERRFPRDLDALKAIFAFIGEFLATSGMEAAYSFNVDLIAEELFTNMVKYSRDGKHDIIIRLERQGRLVLMSLTDQDVEPFDITHGPKVDVDQRLEDRKIGGLGLHLVRKIAEDISYEYKGRTSTITVRTQLEEKHV